MSDEGVRKMDSPVKVIIDSKVIEDIVLQSFKQSIPKIKTIDENLNSVNSETLKKILGIGQKALDNLLDSKILEPIKLGDGFKYPMWMIKEFQEIYRGQDLSTFEKCKLAKEKAAAGTATNKIKPSLL